MNYGKYIHGIILCSIMSLCLLPPPILRYLYFLLILVPTQWWFFDGCFLTKLHEENKNADFVLMILQWFDEDITLKQSNAFTDIILCALLIISTLRIMIYYGVYEQ